MPIREDDAHFKVDRRIPWIGTVGALWFVLARTCPETEFLVIWHVGAATMLIIVSIIIFFGWVLEVDP